MCSNGTRARINSKLVRLEGACEVQHSKYIISFNSKLVRLEVQCERVNDTSRYGFNSKLVRLEVYETQKIIRMIVEFRFQTGAIRSLGLVALPADEFLFQFQTGSIRRHILQLPAFTLIRFNSKLVRLEDIIGNATESITKNVSIPNWCD